MRNVVFGGTKRKGKEKNRDERRRKGSGDSETVHMLSLFIYYFCNICSTFSLLFAVLIIPKLGSFLSS